MGKLVQSNDPHMKSPVLKYILIIIIVALLLVFVVPKVVEIYNDNLKETNEKANK
jgi:type II secretory pathway component PulF